MRVQLKSITKTAATIVVAGSALAVGSADPAAAAPLYTCTGGTGTSGVVQTAESPTGWGTAGSLNLTGCGSGSAGGSATATWQHRTALYWTTCTQPAAGTVVARGRTRVTSQGGAIDSGEFDYTVTALADGTFAFRGTIPAPVPRTAEFRAVVSAQCGAGGHLVSLTITLVSPFTVT